jgi:peptidoglycan/LPS O-acetylase OafA/YrhL
MNGMPTPLSPRLSRNNFDLLRLLFAGTVCLVHCHELSGLPQLGALTRFLSSAVAVKSFFVISGFLIFMSCERSSSFTRYAGKRVRRIYPAYATVIVVAAFSLVAVSNESVATYFSLEWLRYLLANLFFLNFLQPTLPGVFEGNRMAAINGALWTLKIEVLFYLSVPLFILLFKRFGRLTVIFAGYGLSIVYALTCAHLAERSGLALYEQLGRQLPGQLSYFLAGAFFYYYLPWLERRPGQFLVPALLLLVDRTFLPMPVLEPFALATTVVVLAFFGPVIRAGRYGDFSYGVYILHFPLIQLLWHDGRLNDSPWLFLSVAVVLTVASAILLWHGVEKRFLLRSSHYMAATVPPQPQPQTRDSRAADHPSSHRR